MRKVDRNPPPRPQLSAAAVKRLTRRYERLKAKVLDLGWIAQGTVLPHPPSAWRLTRKKNARTVTLALSAAQAALYQQAIANHRRLEAILHQMRQLSDEVIQNSLPGVRKRRRSHQSEPPLS